MSNLVLVKSENFGNVHCDFYSDNATKEVWMTREQIGQALGYADPADAIYRIHERNKERLDGFSVIDRLSGTDGKQYDTYLYSARGVYEICRWSRQPKANAFYDFVYDILEALRTKQATLTSAKSGRVQKSPQIIQLEAEAKARNARVREANLYRGLAREFREVLSEPSIQQLVGLSAQVAYGQPVLPMPHVEKTYSAKEVGQMCGMSANSVGRLANQHNLKTKDYGILVLDKSPHSSKQVQTWRYNERGVAKIKEVLGQ